MLGEASENITKKNNARNHKSELRKRFEDDYDDFIGEQFNIPRVEGKWESYTTNRPSTDAGKTISLLSSARVKLWIPIPEGEEKKRKALSKTEQFVYGAIALRDSVVMTIPEALPLQSGIVWAPVVRGWSVVRAYLFEDDDGKNGKIFSDIAVWDILNVDWISGSRGLLWVCNTRWATPEDVKDQYGEELAPDKNGRVELIDVWDGQEKGVIGGHSDEDNKGWLKKPDVHGIGHPPVLILPNGSTPLVQSERHSDTIKNVGESFAQHNRNLYKTESRMGSYFLTMAGIAAKTPMRAMYDSIKGGQAIEFEGASPFEKGSLVNLDEGKGQKLESGITPQMSRDAYAFWDYLQARERAGGAAAISFGESPFPSTAAGTSQILHQAQTVIHNPRETVETTYVWLAHELISQYKSGNFGEMEIQGIDGSNQKFKVKVKPNEIDDSWQFQAKLIVDMPQDEQAKAGIAVMLKEADLLSGQTIRDRHLDVDDTDYEQQLIDKESAYSVASIAMRKVAAALRVDGDDQGADFIEESIEQARQTQQRGVASQPGVRTPVRPSGQVAAAANEPPDNTTSPRGQSRIRRFLSRGG